MNQDQKEQADVRKLDQELETFNPTWHDGEFLGVNSVWHEKNMPENQNQTHHLCRKGAEKNTNCKSS